MSVESKPSPNALNWYTKQILNVIKYGTIPNHIGFIMDGNRRYAKKNKIQTIEGHIMGSDKLMEMLMVCKHLDIANVTIYAFSIENFKRTQEEVSALIELFVKKYNEILKQMDEFNDNGICVRTIGNFSLIPEELKELMIEVYRKTRHNKRYLNIAFAYTSRDEICRTMETIRSAVGSKKIHENDVDLDLFDKMMFSPKLDVLIRTSGEVRLSDFMLWQSNNTHICFVDVMWPELNIWHIIYCILKYQIHLIDMLSFDKKLEHWEVFEASRKIEEN